MGLFTKKKLSDAERQAWSAQLLEVRAAELVEYGEGPTLGPTWEAHDAEYTRIWAEEYFPEYGYLAWSMMAADGLRSSSYRSIVPGEAMLMLESELEEPPNDWISGGVYWVVNTGELAEDGSQIWGYQYVAADWSSFKSSMKSKVKEWDLENTRKTNKLWKDAWNRYYKWIALAIVAIVVIIVLAPIVAGVALGIVLGETVSVVGAVAAGGAALAGSGMLASASGILESFGGFFESQAAIDDPLFIDSVANFNEDRAEIIGEINSSGTAVMTDDGEVILTDQAPVNPPELNSGGGFVPLLVAAASYMIFI